MNLKSLRTSTPLLIGLSLVLPATPALAQLVINEIDYDQPGTDTAEFIELKNTSAADINLDAYSIELINGSGGTPYGILDLPNETLAAGDYYVICANAGTVANCDIDLSPDTNMIQNGAPDGVLLKLNSSVVDAVSYEGDTAGATETTGIGLMDDGTGIMQGVSRYPDGADTNVNSNDFSIRCTTPGAANSSLGSACDQPVSVQQATWQSVKVLFR